MSLHRSLVLMFSAFLTVFSGVAATFAYVSAGSEAREMLDMQHHQIARFVGDGSNLASLDATLPPHEADEDMVVEVTTADGAPPRRSDPEIVFPAPAPAGFSEFTDSAGRWRLFTLIDGGRTVKVAQRTIVRDELATASALSAAIPFLFAIPLSWLVVTSLVGISIRRLTRLAVAVEARTADTDPIALAGVPSEAKPLVAAMNGALARVRTAMAQQNAFLADAAHELRTPLSALTLQIGNLKRVLNDPAVADRLADLESGARRASAATDQLLRLARQEAGGGERPSEDVALHVITLEAIAGLVALAAGNGVDLGLVQRTTVHVPGSRQDFRLLIETLIDNAVRYTPRGGTVDVAISIEAGRPVLTVSDTGPGIPENLLPRVFDRFFRAASQDQEGSGLGLSIARSIADRYGVALTLRNHADRPGLMARLIFPAR